MSQANRVGADEVCRLEFDVDFPPGHAAAYLIPGDEPLLVDAGTLGSAGEADLEAALADHGVEPADVAHVLLTHPHVDHVGQVTHLREVAEPAVYVPSTHREYLAMDVDAVERRSRANLAEAGVDEDVVAELLPEYRRAEEIVRDVLAPAAIDVWVEPGEPTTVGPLTVEPIHAPGHHRTHVCYAADLRDERVMFSGDVVIEPFRPIAVHAGFDDGVDEGIDAFLTGLDRLAGQEIDRVFPGHGPVHTSYEAAIRQSIDDLHDRVDACESALRPEGSTALQVAVSLAERDFDVARLLPEVVAALATLEREGRARSRVEDGVRYYEPT